MAANTTTFSRSSAQLLSLRQLLLGVLVIACVLCSWMARPVEANCQVENHSGQPVVLVPVVEVGVAVSIDVAVGATVNVPSSQQKCYIKNPSTGHQVGPVSLPNGVVVCVDGAVKGTVDLRVGVLLGITLSLGATIVVGI